MRKPPSIHIQNAYLMPTGEVARMLGVSCQWLRTLDAELEPIFTTRRQRLYQPDRVAAYAAKRAAKGKQAVTATGAR
jgi:hypothetical protein